MCKKVSSAGKEQEAANTDVVVSNIITVQYLRMKVSVRRLRDMKILSTEQET